VKLFGRVAEGERYDRWLSWCHTAGWFRLVLYTGKRRFYARLRWNPKPVRLILEYAWQTDQMVDWGDGEQFYLWETRGLVLPKGTAQLYPRRIS
jgi:hypothetical protein